MLSVWGAIWHICWLKHRGIEGDAPGSEFCGGRQKHHQHSRAA